MNEIPSIKNFDAGRLHRRLRSVPTTKAAINTQIRSYGRTALARSRYVCLNNPYAVAAKEAFVSALAGYGIRPAPKTKDRALKMELQQFFNDWTDQADFDGVTDYYGLQALVAAELFEAGECFVRKHRTRNAALIVPYQLQVLPSEMCPVEMNHTATNGNRIEMGIEFDANNQRTAYYFHRRHPGNDAASTQALAGFVRVPANEVYHVYRATMRSGQIRGIPGTVASLVTLALLDLYDDAELERKRTAALFGAFVTRPAAEDPDDNSHPLGYEENTQHDSSFTLEPGAVIDLEPGETINFAEPADVGSNYEAFEYRNLAKGAAGFGVTYAMMTGDLRQASHSSERIGMIHFRRKIESIQHNTLIYQMCRPTWGDVLVEGALAQELPLSIDEFMARRRELLRVEHIPPRWDWIDPARDIMAERAAVRAGFKPRRAVVSSQGFDIEDVDDEIEEDNTRADEKGLVLDSDPRKTSNAGLTQARAAGSELPDVQPKQGDENDDQE